MKENLRFFEKFSNIFTKFSRNFKEKFRKLWKHAFVGGLGSCAPEASEIIKILLEKLMETCKFSSIMSDFLLKKASLNKK